MLRGLVIILIGLLFGALALVCDVLMYFIDVKKDTKALEDLDKGDKDPRFLN